MLTDLRRILFPMLLIFITLVSGIQGADTEGESPENSEEEKNIPESSGSMDSSNASDEKVWLADSKTVFDIIEPLREFKARSDDSSVQEKWRKKKLGAMLLALNEKMSGKPLVLMSVKVEDVSPEREITKYGIKRLQSLRKQIEKDPATKAYLQGLGDDWASNPLFAFTLGFYLVGCEKCFRDTGRYIAKFKITREPNNEYAINDGIKIIKPNTSDGSPEEQYGNEKFISVEIDVLIPTEDQALKMQKGSVQPLKRRILNINYEGSDFSEKVKIYLQ